MSTTERLARSHELAAWIERQVDGLPGPALLRNRLASPCFVVVQEHHQAILLLFAQRHPLHASAFALVRPVYESLVRGVWLWHCASEAELQAFSKGGKPPSMPTILKAVEQTPSYAGGQLSAVYSRSWETMCAYTHTGAQQIQRWNTSDLIAANYSDEEVDEVLRFTGTFALLSTLGLATVAADDALAHRTLEKSREWAK